VPRKPRHKEIQFGDLPVDKINRAWSLELDEGIVVMSGNAQTHARRRHPEDFARCFPHVAAIVTNPLYVGDDLKNEGKIELISRVPAIGTALLVAVNIEVDDKGRYHVVSFYPVNERKLGNRLDKGFLKIAK
jgi:hypothetical protein